MKTRKHPAAIALKSWMNSDEGKSATQPTTLNAPEMMRLENRLHRAFNAGWWACMNHNFEISPTGCWVLRNQKNKTVAAMPNEKS